MASLSAPLFSISSKSAWQTQVQKEAKDADAYERLRWQTDEGFVLDPYYTTEDLLKVPVDTLQRAQRAVAGWLNAPEYMVASEKADNLTLRDALLRGASALVLTLTGVPDLSQLLNGIKLSETPVFFRFRTEDSPVKAADFIRGLKTIAPYQLKGGLLMDSVSDMAEITRQTADSLLFRTIGISSHAFHNAGASVTQELAFTLGMLADTYDALTDDGLLIDQLVSKTMLSISVGTSYFMEIAKLRALRVLTARFLSCYSPMGSHSLFIHAQTSTFYDAVPAPYTNLLRSTTEAMAATIGGCDALTVHPYDAVMVMGPGNAFGVRIARNISVLLRDESQLDKVADPAAGSYYIETLTHQLAESAWALFLDVEKRGGYRQALTDGFIRNEIDQAYQTKIDAVKNGKVLVGVTQFRESTPVTKHTEEPVSPKGGELPNRRLAEAFD